jgi:hypothetical protein
MPWRHMGKWRYSSTILDLGTKYVWVVNFTHRPRYPRGKSPRYALDRRLGGPRNLYGRSEVKNIYPVEIPTPAARPVSRRFTNLAIPTVLIKCMEWISNYLWLFSTGPDVGNRKLTGKLRPTHTRIYIYIYIYMCVCVCVCVSKLSNFINSVLYIVRKPGKGTDKLSLDLIKGMKQSVDLLYGESEHWKAEHREVKDVLQWLGLALSKEPNRAGVFPSPSPEDGNRSSFRNVVFSSF